MDTIVYIFASLGVGAVVWGISHISLTSYFRSTQKTQDIKNLKNKINILEVDIQVNDKTIRRDYKEGLTILRSDLEGTLIEHNTRIKDHAERIEDLEQHMADLLSKAIGNTNAIARLTKAVDELESQIIDKGTRKKPK